MRLTLRKGQSSAYFQYGEYGESIGADNFEVELEGTTAVIRFNLRPVDSNQRADEEKLHADQLTEVHLSDSYVLDRLAAFLSADHIKAESLALEILSQGRRLRFPVAFGPAGIGFLPLVLQREAG